MSQTTIFLVQKLYWWTWRNDDEEPVYCRFEEGSIPVRAFTDYDRASDYQRAQEQARRAEVNPFYYGEKLADLSSFTAEPFHDWLLDAGLTPWTIRKDKDFKKYRTWWKKNRGQMTDLQRTRVWEALDKVRFFEIVELEEAV
jgi:hypothetical protein